MVQLHVKRGDESQFLFNTTVDASVETVIQQIAVIYNGKLKVERICSGENTCCLYSLYMDKNVNIIHFFAVGQILNTWECFCFVLFFLVLCVCACRDPRADRSWHHPATQHAGADRGASSGAQAKR